MNMYERFCEGTFPEEIQRQAESFAANGESNAEYLFRAGFFVRKNIKKILENTEGGRMKTEKLTENRGTYEADHEARCCWNCRHAYSRFNLSLLCKNPDEWVMESAVEPTGVCDSWEKREEENG